STCLTRLRLPFGLQRRSSYSKHMATCQSVEQQKTLMAELVPEKIPSQASAGEKRVFALLQKLSDDCIIYYEPVIKVGDREEPQKHPLRQARDYMFRLKDKARKHLDTSALFEASGKYKGQFHFPFGHMVELSNMRRVHMGSLSPNLFPSFPNRV
ncbi:MAG: hypothetical protein AAF709_04840, partial [Pseudomonadota bacterium]